MEITLDRDDLINEVSVNFYGDTDLLIELVSKGAVTFEDMAKVIKGTWDELRNYGGFTDVEILEMIHSE